LRWVIKCGFWSSFIANTINVAADLGAMADATRLLVGGPAILYVVTYGAISVFAQIFFNYKRYVTILKWPTLALFAYVIALAVVHVPWPEALKVQKSRSVRSF
jgi:Natural resistance-associated macrophage protein